MNENRSQQIENAERKNSTIRTDFMTVRLKSIRTANIGSGGEMNIRLAVRTLEVVLTTMKTPMFHPTRHFRRYAT